MREEKSAPGRVVEITKVCHVFKMKALIHVKLVWYQESRQLDSPKRHNTPSIYKFDAHVTMVMTTIYNHAVLR